MTRGSLHRLLALMLIGLVRSDQYSFVRRGVPSLFPFMGLRSDSGVDAAARFKEWLATRYHTPQDDLGQPMDFDSGARQAQFGFLVGVGGRRRGPAAGLEEGRLLRAHVCSSDHQRG